MSLSNKIKILKTRKKLDLLDDVLLNIIKKRTNLVKKILESKTSKNQIIDKKRIKYAFLLGTLGTPPRCIANTRAIMGKTKILLRTALGTEGTY